MGSGSRRGAPLPPATWPPIRLFLHPLHGSLEAPLGALSQPQWLSREQRGRWKATISAAGGSGEGTPLPAHLSPSASSRLCLGRAQGKGALPSMKCLARPHKGTAGVISADPAFTAAICHHCYSRPGASGAAVVRSAPRLSFRQRPALPALPGQGPRLPPLFAEGTRAGRSNPSGSISELLVGDAVLNQLKCISAW